jgi:hypothetical protein
MSTPIAAESTTPSNRSRKLPEWQRKAIKFLIWKLSLAAVVGVVGAALLDRFFPDPYRTASHLLWLPWMVALLLGIPIAYRQGIRDGRSHRDGDEVGG